MILSLKDKKVSRDDQPGPSKMICSAPPMLSL